MAEQLESIMQQWNKKSDSLVAVRGLARETLPRIPFSAPIMNYQTYGGLPRKRIIEFFGPESSGKAQPLTSKVLTKDGFIDMSDVKVGTKVLDGKGNETTVTGVFPQGKRDIYRINLHDKTYIEVSDEHLNSVFVYNEDRKCRVNHVLNTLELKDWVEGKSRFSVRIEAPILDSWEEKPLPIHPYLLGALLGDGSLSNNFGFSNSESDVVDKVNSLLNELNYELRPVKNTKVDYAICRKDGKVFNQFSNREESLKLKMEDLGLLVKSIDKHIPPQYLYNSIENRVQLLQGLFDTDGYSNSEGYLSFTTSSKQLSKDMEFLCRSLGARLSTVVAPASYKDSEGVEIKCNDSYTLYVKFPNDILYCTSKKHLSRRKLNKKGIFRTIKSVEFDRVDYCQCIMVESDEHTYITDNVTVTHNTTTALDIVKNAQILFQDEWEEANERLAKELEEAKEKKLSKAKITELELELAMWKKPKQVVYMDLENTLDEEWATSLGVDVESLWIVKPGSDTAEQILQYVLDMYDTGEVGLVVLDSLPYMVSQNLIDETLEKKAYAGISGPLTEFSRKVQPKLTKQNAMFLGINQIREDMNSQYNAYSTPGGKMWKHACSVRLKFRKGDYFDKNGARVNRTAENPEGNLVESFVEKTKAFRPNRKMVSYKLSYYDGILIEEDLIDIAVKYNYVQKGGAWYSVIDPETGEIMSSEEKGAYKFQGLARFVAALKEDDDLFNYLMEKVHAEITAE